MLGLGGGGGRQAAMPVQAAARLRRGDIGLDKAETPQRNLYNEWFPL